MKLYGQGRILLVDQAAVELAGLQLAEKEYCLAKENKAAPKAELRKEGSSLTGGA